MPAFRAFSFGKWLFSSAVLIAFFALPSFAQNALQVTAISGAANSSTGNGNTVPVIYGGIAGLIADCNTTAAGSFCNNCVDPDVACNRQRIHANLVLRINFKVIADITGSIHLGYSVGGTITEFDPNTEYTRSTTNELSQDDTGFVEIPWGELCNVDYGDPTCDGGPAVPGDNMVLHISIEQGTADFDSGTTVNVNVSILGYPTTTADLLTCAAASPDAGICDFTASPGDEKVYIEPTGIANSCPSEFQFARVHYSTVDFASANYNTSTYEDLEMGNDCAEEGEWVVDDLQNDVPYFFRIAMLDIAKNEFYLTDQNDLNVTYPDCTGPTDAGCPQIATPGNVIGLLPEDFNCFIATAAFGTNFEKHVNDLRQFRNKFLLPSQLGKKMVKLYYSYGPKGAKFISNKPWLKTAVRTLLLPVWGYAWLSLHYGAWGTLFVLMVVIGFVAFYVRGLRRGEW